MTAAAAAARNPDGDDDNDDDVTAVEPKAYKRLSRIIQIGRCKRQ